jgi:hypothetical protein
MDNLEKHLKEPWEKLYSTQVASYNYEKQTTVRWKTSDQNNHSLNPTGANDDQIKSLTTWTTVLKT